jgi:hypothetical protein
MYNSKCLSVILFRRFTNLIKILYVSLKFISHNITIKLMQKISCTGGVKMQD